MNTDDDETSPSRRQEVRPYDLPGRGGPARSGMADRGDYLHHRWFWQEPHLKYLDPDRVYSLAERQWMESSEAGRSIEAQDRRLFVRRLLRGLPDRQRAVLACRFGLADGQTYTLEETGLMLGVSAERVRQLEARVLFRLRRRLKRLIGSAAAV